MAKIFTIALKFTGALLALLTISAMLSSSFDIYNNFAYDKAIIRESPFGMTPLLNDPKDYSSANGFIHSGDFVYVVDWLSAYNGKVVFAKVKSKFKEGYINKELLVEANINVLPIISVLVLTFVFIFGSVKLYHKLIT